MGQFWLTRGPRCWLWGCLRIGGGVSIRGDESTGHDFPCWYTSPFTARVCPFGPKHMLVPFKHHEGLNNWNRVVGYSKTRISHHHRSRMLATLYPSILACSLFGCLGIRTWPFVKQIGGFHLKVGIQPTEVPLFGIGDPTS